MAYPGEVCNVSNGVLVCCQPLMILQVVIEHLQPASRSIIHSFNIMLPIQRSGGVLKNLLGQISYPPYPVLSRTLSMKDLIASIEHRAYFTESATQVSAQWDEHRTAVHSLQHQTADYSKYGELCLIAWQCKQIGNARYMCLLRYVLTSQAGACIKQYVPGIACWSHLHICSLHTQSALVHTARSDLPAHE